MKYRAFIFTLLTITLILSACQPQVDETSTQLPPLRVEWTNWWGDYTMIIAEEKGLFEKHGVEVEPVYYDDFTTSVPDMAANIIDGALFSIGDAVQVSEKNGSMIVAVYDNGGSIFIAATPEIKQISDLRGKSIGVDIGTAYELFVVEMLKSGGLNKNDVKFVDVNENEIPFALGKSIQAGLTHVSTSIGSGNHIIYESDVISSLYPDVIVFQKNVIQQRPLDVQNFLRAWFEAVEFRKTNSTESKQIIAKRLNISIDDIKGDARLTSLPENMDLFSDVSGKSPDSIRYITNLHMEFLLRLGSLKNSMDLNSILNQSLLK